MEGKKNELFDQELFENKNSTVEHLANDKLNEFISESKIAKKTDEELAQDKEMMNTFLNDLKKENFKLDITVTAWKNTFKNKLEEFAEVDLKLDKIHKEIQSERKEFCSKADLFINKCGILSDWWEKQMKFVFEFENHDTTNSEEQKIKQLEKEIKEIEKQVEFVQAENNSKLEENFTIIRTSGTFEDVSPERLNAKTKISAEEEEEEEDWIKFCEENGSELEKRLFSLVDVEKVRLATRKINQCKKFPKRD